MSEAETRDRLAPSLDGDGAVLHSGLADPVLTDLETIISKYPDGKAGFRISGDSRLAEILSASYPIGATVAAVLGEGARPVRAVLFDKNDAADWSLGWHQDRTIAVRSWAELSGFGPWSLKQGIQHVEPPFAVIDAMLTVRIHLDPVDEENGPLLITLGSHCLGRIETSDVNRVAEGLSLYMCLAELGDVWFYRTPIIHASRAARPGRRRRVLQVDYTAQDLPAPLERLGIGA